jgi:uncharacterized radical SAM superfamily Fe-S cluster-containing enzyme
MKTLEKKSLFWDSEKLDINKNKKHIVERILAFGDVDDFVWMMKKYDKEEVKEIFLNSRRLDKKSINFWQYYFNINDKKWEKDQSTKKQSMFWRK